MAFNYETEYKKNIRTYIQKIKNTRESKHTKTGKEITALKKNCLCLLEKINEFGYNPHVATSSFFVTESRVGFNKQGFTPMEELMEIQIFLHSFLSTNN